VRSAAQKATNSSGEEARASSKLLAAQRAHNALASASGSPAHGCRQRRTPHRARRLRNQDEMMTAGRQGSREATESGRTVEALHDGQVHRLHPLGLALISQEPADARVFHWLRVAVVAVPGACRARPGRPLRRLSVAIVIDVRGRRCGGREQERSHK
jgi:hypothetical protein